MLFLLAAALTTLLQAPPGELPARPLVQKLSCVDRLDNSHQPMGLPLMMWATSREPRLENIQLYPDGYVRLSVQIQFGGFVDCRAKLTPERVAAFTSEITKTKFWRLRTAKSVNGMQRESLYVDLGGIHRCHVQMTPGQWAKAPAARAFQAAIDRLKREVCGGSCPEPKTRDRDPTPAKDFRDMLRIASPAQQKQ